MALPVAVSALTAGLGILSFVFVLFSIINTPSEGPIDLDREIWVFVGVVLTAGIAYGGWMGMREEGTSFGEQADRVQDRASGPGDGTTGGGPAGPGDSAPPPPPPPPPPSSGGTAGLDSLELQARRRGEQRRPPSGGRRLFSGPLRERRDDRGAGPGPEAEGDGRVEHPLEPEGVRAGSGLQVERS